MTCVTTSRMWPIAYFKNRVEVKIIWAFFNVVTIVGTVAEFGTVARVRQVIIVGDRENIRACFITGIITGSISWGSRRFLGGFRGRGFF